MGGRSCLLTPSICILDKCVGGTSPKIDFLKIHCRGVELLATECCDKIPHGCKKWLGKFP